MQRQKLKRVCVQEYRDKSTQNNSWTGMKAKIDIFVRDNYDKLINIAQKKISYFNRNISPQVMVSEAYIYVVNNQPKKEIDIPKYMVNYINQELKYTNSVTLGKHNLRCLDSEFIFLTDANYLIEDTYDRQQCIEQFSKSLSRQDQIVWEVYYHKGKRKIKEIAEHFNIAMSSAYQLRNNILDKFEQFYKENYKDEN